VLNHVSLHVGLMELIKTAGSVGYVQQAMTANGDKKDGPNDLCQSGGPYCQARHLEAHTVKLDKHKRQIELKHRKWIEFFKAVFFTELS